MARAWSRLCVSMAPDVGPVFVTAVNLSILQLDKGILLIFLR